MKPSILIILIVIYIEQSVLEPQCKEATEKISNLNGVLLLPSTDMVITLCNTTAIPHGQPLNLEVYQEYIKFRKNRPLQRIFSNAFSLVPNVQTLILSELEITDIEQNSLKGLDNLRYLDLEKNKIASLPDNLFDDTPNLVELNLEDNKLSHISERQFAKLNNLKKLKITKNQLSDLPNLWQEGLHNLEYLSLTHNKLTRLVSGTFEGLINLQTLRLDGNVIRTLESGCFSGLGSLKSLSLHSNGHINSENVLTELQTLENLKGLSISPPDVECQLLSSIKTWTDEQNIDLIKISSSNPSVCRQF